MGFFIGKDSNTFHNREVSFSLKLIQTLLMMYWMKRSLKFDLKLMLLFMLAIICLLDTRTGIISYLITCFNMFYNTLVLWYSSIFFI